MLRTLKKIVAIRLNKPAALVSVPEINKRTSDPELWSKHAKGRKIDLARPSQFGRGRRGLEARLRDSLGDAMTEFCRNCSIGGFKQLVSEDTDKWQRYCLLVLLSVCLFSGVVVAAMDMEEFLRQPPLHVSLLTAQHSVRLVPFPAIAFCSYNVISLRELDFLTSYLSKKTQNRTYSPAAIRRNLLTFGSLLTMSLPPLDLQFMPFLTGVGTGDGFNVTKLMYLLSPSCEEMLVKCSWRGREQPCSLLFGTRLTSVGFCCVFNSRYEQVDYDTPPKILDLVGQDNGLSVILREDSNDVAFLRRPVLGTEVLIFDGSEYPLLEGGAVRVQIVPRHANVYFALTAREQVASSDLKYYTESWRGCRMKQPGQRRRLRSYSWCLTECRRRAALQLCGCVPYTLQPRGELICSLNQLSCLNKHKEKFLYYYPFGYALESLSQESQDALSCEDCRADCARPVYSAVAALAYVKRREKLFTNKFTTGQSLVNVSVLRFFYATEDQQLFSIEGNNNWYEILASITSQWVFLIGMSLLTVFELVFHCTVRWRYYYVRRRAAARAHHSTPSYIY